LQKEWTFGKKMVANFLFTYSIKAVKNNNVVTDFLSCRYISVLKKAEHEIKSLLENTQEK
jgi:hypothetical protein